VDEVRAEEGCWHDLQRDLQRADCMGVDPLVFALTRDTPLTHKGGGKKFANHSAVNNWLSGMAALVDVLGIMRVLADASVMRIILMINAIADGPHSTESSKTYPFSLRAAFTAEKVRLEEEVLTHNRMIGNISCSSGGGSVSTNDAASAKSTPKKRAKETDEARELQQSANHQNRLEHEIVQLRAANVQIKRARDDAGGRSGVREQSRRSVSPPFKPSRPTTSRTQTARTATAR